MFCVPVAVQNVRSIGCPNMRCRLNACGALVTTYLSMLLKKWSVDASDVQGSDGATLSREELTVVASARYSMWWCSLLKAIMKASCPFILPVIWLCVRAGCSCLRRVVARRFKVLIAAIGGGNEGEGGGAPAPAATSGEAASAPASEDLSDASAGVGAGDGAGAPEEAQNDSTADGAADTVDTVEMTVEDV